MTITRTYTFELPNLEYFRDELGWEVETEEDVVEIFKGLTFDGIGKVCHTCSVKTRKI